MTEQHQPSAPQLSFALDSNRPAPLYQQLSDCLRRQVLGANWPADSAIPSERELMRLTGLSRMTVRQAIDSLTREGLLTRIHGRGTFIVPERVEQEMRGVYSFTARILDQGRIPSTHILEATQMPVDRDDAQLLGLAPGAAIYRLTRLRCIDGEPVVVDIVKLPAERFDGVPENEFSMMTLASRIGISVPEIDLVDVDSLVGLP